MSETQDAIVKAANAANVDESAATRIAAELEKAGYVVTKAPAPVAQNELKTGEAPPAPAA